MKMKMYLHVLHNQQANIEIDRAAGRISMVNTSLGYTYGIGPSPIANILMKIKVKINETIARMILFRRTISQVNQIHTYMNFNEYTKWNH